MEILNVEVSTRECSGKGYAKKIRNRGIVPAILYGRKENPLLLQLNTKDVQNVLKSQSGENSILKLSFVGNGQESVTAMIQDIQRDIMKPNILHVDFKRISLEETTIVNVPVEITHEPKEGRGIGMVEQLIWELEVECLPMSIPKSIEVDLSELKIGDSLAVSDLKTVEGIKILNDATETIFVYKETKEEQLPAEGDSLFPAEKSEPVVIAKRKEED